MVLTAGTIYVQIIHLKIQNFEYVEPGKEIKKKKKGQVATMIIICCCIR